MRPRQQSLRIGAAACTVLIIWQVLPLPSSASQLQPDLNAELQAKTLAAGAMSVSADIAKSVGILDNLTKNLGNIMAHRSFDMSTSRRLHQSGFV